MIDKQLIKNSLILGYRRKSQDDKRRQVQSLSDQSKIIYRLAKMHGASIPKQNDLSEERTASKPGRPVFNNLIELIKQSNYTILFCWHFNRLARNPIDKGILEWLLQEGKLMIVTESQIFDQSTNAVVTSVEGGTSTQYSIDLSRTVRGRLQLKRERGIPSGVAAPGYRNAHLPDDEESTRWWEPDDDKPNRFLLIESAIKLVLDGTEPMAALRTLNDEWSFRTIKHHKIGGAPLGKNSWYNLLRNPITCGYFVSKGQWYKVDHPKFQPMLTEDQYWKLQALLGKRGRTRPKLQEEDQAAFLKTITCGSCGDMLSRDRKRHTRCECGKKYSSLHNQICPICGKHNSLVDNKRKHDYDFYFCPTAKVSKKQKCAQPKIDTSDIEAEIAKILDNITIPKVFIQLALDYLNERADDEVISQEATLESLQHAYELKQKELYRLNKSYRTGGYDYDGGEEDYQKELKPLIAAKKHMKKQIDEFDVMADDWRAKTEQGYLFCKEALAAFTEPNADYRTKREILLSLCSKATLKGQRLIIDLETPFEFIRKKLDAIKTKYHVTEPEEIEELLNGKANKAIADAIKSTWRRGWDSNPRSV